MKEWEQFLLYEDLSRGNTNLRQLIHGRLSYLIIQINAKRENFQSYELLAKSLTDDLRHRSKHPNLVGIYTWAARIWF